MRDWEGFFALPREEDGQGPPRPMAPLACVPTTAGTGSEVSFAAVVRDAGGGDQGRGGRLRALPRLAVLDPETTRTLPPCVAAATGMDALTHAVEGYVSSEWSPHGDAFALHALRLIREHLERAVADPADEDARGNMLVAASLAIVPTGTGAIGISHSMAHACGGRHGVPHGVANAIVLPHVIRWNADAGPEVLGRYGEVAGALGVDTNGSAGTTWRARGGPARAAGPSRTAVRGGGARRVGPRPRGGGHGRRLHAGEPARAGPGGPRGAVPQRALRPPGLSASPAGGRSGRPARVELAVAQVVGAVGPNRVLARSAVDLVARPVAREQAVVAAAAAQLGAAAARDEHVVARPALDLVVAHAAVEVVGPAVALQLVIADLAEEEVGTVAALHLVRPRARVGGRRRRRPRARGRHPCPR